MLHQIQDNTFPIGEAIGAHLNPMVSEQLCPVIWAVINQIPTRSDKQILMMTKNQTLIEKLGNMQEKTKKSSFGGDFFDCWLLAVNC